MQPDFDSRGATRPLSAFLWLAMLGCPAWWAHGQLAASACARAGVGSLRVVLRWGLRVAAALQGGGGGCVLACVCAPPSLQATIVGRSEAAV